VFDATPHGYKVNVSWSPTAEQTIPRTCNDHPSFVFRRGKKSAGANITFRSRVMRAKMFEICLCVENIQWYRGFRGEWTNERKRRLIRDTLLFHRFTRT